MALSFRHREMDAARFSSRHARQLFRKSRIGASLLAIVESQPVERRVIGHIVRLGRQRGAAQSQSCHVLFLKYLARRTLRSKPKASMPLRCLT
jgi:hypothetical protein